MRVLEVKEADIRKAIPPRRRSSRKGENGKVLIIGGSYMYHGAPLLASLSAFRVGVDLVYLAVPKPLSVPIRAYTPDLIVIPLPDLKITHGVTTKILKLITRGRISVDAALLGPGLSGIRKEIGILAYKLNSLDIKLVLDAGALYPEIIERIKGSNSVITPHAGEFYRIFKEKIEGYDEKRLDIVYKYAKETGLTILLKGMFDVISDGNDVYINRTGNAGMTVGGTGDILAGLVAGFLAKGLSPLKAAFTAAYINGKCGENLFVNKGLHYTASDFIDELPNVIRIFDNIIE
jgi:NAD(P)H-hydrate epimerase